MMNELTNYIAEPWILYGGIGYPDSNSIIMIINCSRESIQIAYSKLLVYFS